jgi:hypothetical protein
MPRWIPRPLVNDRSVPSRSPVQPPGGAAGCRGSLTAAAWRLVVLPWPLTR